jgi:hypothetical protein
LANQLRHRYLYLEQLEHQKAPRLDFATHELTSWRAELLRVAEL